MRVMNDTNLQKMTDKKYKFLGRYKKDPAVKWVGVGILIVGSLFIWATPAYWPIVVGFWLFVVLIAYLYRNAP